MLTKINFFFNQIISNFTSSLHAFSHNNGPINGLFEAQHHVATSSFMGSIVSIQKFTRLAWRFDVRRSQWLVSQFYWPGSNNETLETSHAVRFQSSQWICSCYERIKLLPPKMERNLRPLGDRGPLKKEKNPPGPGFDLRASTRLAAHSANWVNQKLAVGSRMLTVATRLGHSYSKGEIRHEWLHRTLMIIDICVTWQLLNLKMLRHFIDAFWLYESSIRSALFKSIFLAEISR